MEPEVKRHIDNARQVLVGVVPNPISQIDQITYALIYKFMDDMDQSAIVEGGEPSFFIHDLEPYSWTKLMDSKIGNQNRMNLYVEAFQKFSEAEQLPELFRNILRQAFLPYRSPDVLWLFLKEIDYFDYSHPEELGNAYEYLLSIMGSQGDAGQFRTPRHIIDFIVDVIQPTENDKILDPACGTGGFLVKAYQHILEQHQGDKKLNPAQKLKIMENFEGYDIDPGMARIAQVNMFLHQFKSPKIIQYDTLSMEERWNDKFDVIMANPPFMSPKGGIKPHSKFSVQSTRSEVLFVDYIMNHLKPKGRAGIIVPEGIIFQSGNAYKQLRKNLVNDGLYAVVSLPSGVFQPYSGVKTSILLFNNEIAKQREEIVFIKIENDGFDLGANKRPINKNDLPEALEILSKWNINEKVTSKKALWVTKSKLSESGDYNLSGDRYRITTDYSNAKYPMVELGEVADYINGFPFKPSDWVPDGKISIIRIQNLTGSSKSLNFTNRVDIPECNVVYNGDLLISWSATIGFYIWTSEKSYLNQHIFKVIPNNRILKKYLFYLGGKISELIEQKVHGNTMTHIIKGDFIKIRIPLPPLEIQQQIVEELDSYQNIINGAKQIIANWKPNIDIDPSWPLEKIENIATVVRGSSPRPQGDLRYYGGSVPRLMVSDVTRDGMYTTPKNDFLTDDGAKLSRPMKAREVIMAVSGNPGLPTILSVDACIHDGFVGFRDLSTNLLPEFFYYVLLWQKESNKMQSVGAVFKNLTTDQIKLFEIPLPPLEIQQQIVEYIESERVLVESAKKLITLYTQKISTTLAKLWEE